MNCRTVSDRSCRRVWTLYSVTCVSWRWASITVHCRKVSGLSAKIRVSDAVAGAGGAAPGSAELAGQALDAGDRDRAVEADVFRQQDAQRRAADSGMLLVCCNAESWNASTPWPATSRKGGAGRTGSASCPGRSSQAVPCEIAPSGATWGSAPSAMSARSDRPRPERCRPCPGGTGLRPAMGGERKQAAVASRVRRANM